MTGGWGSGRRRRLEGCATSEKPILVGPAVENIGQKFSYSLGNPSEMSAVLKPSEKLPVGPKGAGPAASVPQSGRHPRPTAGFPQKPRCSTSTDQSQRMNASALCPHTCILSGAARTTSEASPQTDEACGGRGSGRRLHDELW